MKNPEIGSAQKKMEAAIPSSRTRALLCDARGEVVRYATTEERDASRGQRKTHPAGFIYVSWNFLEPSRHAFVVDETEDDHAMSGAVVLSHGFVHHKPQERHASNMQFRRENDTEEDVESGEAPRFSLKEAFRDVVKSLRSKLEEEEKTRAIRHAEVRLEHEKTVAEAMAKEAPLGPDHRDTDTEPHPHEDLLKLSKEDRELYWHRRRTAGRKLSVKEALVDWKDPEPEEKSPITQNEAK